MKISLAKSRERGAIWLVIFIFIAVAILAAWLFIKICEWRPNIVQNHGEPDPETNLVDQAMAALHAAYGSNAVIRVPELGGVELPIRALAYEWSYAVQASTNLTDWFTVPLEWPEALDSIQTNHTAPIMFFRRVVFW